MQPAGLWPPPHSALLSSDPSTDPSFLLPAPGAAVPATSAWQAPTCSLMLSGPQPGPAVTAQQRPLCPLSGLPEQAAAHLYIPAGPGLGLASVQLPACSSSLRSVWIKYHFQHFLSSGWLCVRKRSLSPGTCELLGKLGTSLQTDDCLHEDGLHSQMTPPTKAGRRSLSLVCSLPHPGS